MMATEPNTGLTWQEANSLTTDALHNQVIDFVSIWVNCIVLAVGQAAPTGTEVDGDRYIVGTGTGVFSGHDDELAILRGGTWQFHAPPAAGVPIIKNLDDGTDWECDETGSWSIKGTGFNGGSLSGALNEAKGADIASAATTDIGAATGNLVRVTGATTITALGTAQAGAARTVVFVAALTLTHHATSLILPTAANIITAAGDVAQFRSEGSGDWRCTGYLRADGTPLAGGGGGGGGGMVLIGSDTAASPAASLSVSGIPGTYSALMVVFVGRGSTAALAAETRVRFNGDTGTNYDFEEFNATGGASGFSQTLGATSARMGYMPAATATANRAGMTHLSIPNYAGTTFDKIAAAYTASAFNASGSAINAGAPSMCWRPATPVAVTSVTVFPSAGNVVAGSKLMVYGLP
jgi:hypothetical protein